MDVTLAGGEQLRAGVQPSGSLVRSVWQRGNDLCAVGSDSVTMQIKNIVLYSRDGQVRDLPLRLGQLNIITGASRRGKSALLDVVDYCLGRSTCNVPLRIRNVVSWFGLRLQLPEYQIFVARASPDPGFQSSTAVFLDVGAEVSIPSFQDLSQVANPDALERFLTRAIGISENLHVPAEGQSRPSLEANIRHALFYCFQGQGEVANRSQLFHRQGDDRIPQAIRDTLPYFLGAVDDDHLARIHGLRLAKRELRIAERRLDEARTGDEGFIRALALLSEAEQVGLLGSTPSDDRIQTDLISSLRSAVEGFREQAPFVPGDAASRLFDERRQLLGEYQSVDEEIRTLRTLLDDQDGVATEGQRQLQRLESIRLFPEPQNSTSECPLCGQQVAEAVSRVQVLQDALTQVRLQLDTVGRERAHVTNAVAEREAERARILGRLRDNQFAIDALTVQQSEVGSQRELQELRSYTAGRISLYLETVSPQALDQLQLERDRLAARVEQLERQLEESGGDARADSMLNIVSRRLTEMAQALDLEHRDVPLRLDRRGLTVVTDTLDGPVPMLGTGSGANWLAYHLATHVALHWWFIERGRPVPRFLWLDQPTQVYYPPERDQDGSIDILRDEDREAVARLFQWFYQAPVEFAPGLQVIVLDHADHLDERFNSYVVERWRDSNALVPQSWFS